MKLKNRLLVSFFILVFLPLILVIMTVFIPGNYGIHVVSGDVEEIMDVVISLTMILAFTAAIFIIWIYNAIISKVNRLIFAANNIKEGNLDFSIASSGKDELSELLNTFEDMKDRLKEDSEEKLHIEKEQKELISNIAHDLKTPLTAIRGYAQGLLDGVADTEEKKTNYIRTISRKAEELDSLLNELTIYANISTNRIPYNFSHVSVADYFYDVIDELSGEYSDRNVAINTVIDVEKDVEMIADPEQLHRVIQNIVGNAYKYKRQENLVLEFRVHKAEGGYIQVEIEDNGTGIKTEELTKIFDRMYRGDASRNSDVGGSGIGLSIVKKIIEDHGGKIWVTSRLNEGSCFYFLLRQYTIKDFPEKENLNEQNLNTRRRRGNIKSRERLSGD